MWVGVTEEQARAAISGHEMIPVTDRYFLHARDIVEFGALKKPTKDVLDLLTQWDYYTMGYAPDGRERYVDSGVQGQVYGSLGATRGNASGVILLNGLAQGLWRSRFKGQKMVASLNMFGKRTRKLREQMETQYNKLSTLLGARSVEFGGV